MNTRKLFATSLIALASVAASSAFAEDGYDHNYPVIAATAGSSTVTRAQVRAELIQAEKDGSLAAISDNDYPVLHSTGPAKTRAEVRAELIQAEKDGSLAEISNNNYPVLHSSGPSKTRDEVRAETAAAMKDGTLNYRG